MPFYEYRCEHCDHKLEVLQKISDSPLVDCPECARPALKKLVSTAGFRLKGSGWYETDFKGGKRKNLHEGREKKEGGEKKDAGSSQNTKQEKRGDGTKPAAESKVSATG